jgi:K+-sensing histidine kinase KdpD
MIVALSTLIFLLLASGICLLLVRRHYVKLLDVTLRRAQKSERLKSVFIENISRTLRSPLNAIVDQCSNILEEKDGYQQPAEVRKSVADISEYSKELASYVSQLHEMSKFEGVTPSFTFIEVNIIELMASYRREAMNYTKPDVAVRVSTDLSPHCRGILDTNLMHQLMMHLLINAAHHVTHGDIYIKYTCERRGLKVAVSYTGMEHNAHVDNDILQILEKDDAVKEMGLSAVFGIAICRAIVDMFGGEFFMEMENGKKQVASFWFPCEMKDTYKDL